MVKITLYNIGGQKEVLFYIVLCTSFLPIILIPNELKEFPGDIYLDTRIQVLRCFGTLRVLHLKRIIQQLSTIYVFPHSIYIISKPEYDGFAV